MVAVRAGAVTFPRDTEARFREADQDGVEVVEVEDQEVLEEQLVMVRVPLPEATPFPVTFTQASVGPEAFQHRPEDQYVRVPVRCLRGSPNAEG